MYFRPASATDAETYLHGFEAECAAGGLPVSRDVYHAACALRGWRHESTRVFWHVESKGMTLEASIQELIAVEVEAFRLAASQMAAT